MKKMIIAAMALACTAAFANGEGHGSQAAGTQQQQKQNTEVSTSSAAVSTAKGGSQQQGIKDSGNSTAAAGVTSAGNSAVTVGCLVNCASTDQGQKDLADAGIAVATINAAAARDIAATTQVVKNTPSIVNSALVSSNDTCMGSVSVGGSGPGFSIGVGTTYKDENCVMLKNSRELWNMGMKAASLALMCTDKANREALEMTGFECPQTTAAKKADADKAAVKKAEAEAAAKVASTGGAERLATAYTGNDPIVQARMAASK